MKIYEPEKSHLDCNQNYSSAGGCGDVIDIWIGFDEIGMITLEQTLFIP